MTKGRRKTNSSDAMGPPQRRTLRSKKRECPSDKDTKEVSVSCVGALPQSPQYPLKDCIVNIVQHRQAAEHTFITKQDTTEENGVNDYDLTVKPCDMQEVTTIINLSSEVQLGGYPLHCDKDAKEDGKEKEQKKAPNCSKSTSKTCAQPTQMSIAMSEEGNESKPSALKDELSTEDKPDHKMETNNEESNNMCMDDAKEKEATVELPSKKKRRLGMCHLTEKERNPFLHVQNRANGKPQKERQNCNDQVVEKETICPPHTPSSPQLNPVTTSGREQSDAEIKLQSIDSGEDSSNINICEPKTPRALDPEQTPELQSHGEVEEKLNNQEQMEAVGVSEIPEDNTKNTEDMPAEVDTDRTINSHTSTNWTKETMTENQDVTKTPTEQVHKHFDEMNEVVPDDDEDNGPEVESSPTDMPTGVISNGSLEICKAPGTPIDLERTDSTRETKDLFGCGGLDYVSDSQLNTIVLTEEKTSRKTDIGSSDVYEDGTNLICGLIRELASLNRTLMVTHRELETLRHKSKNSRSFL